MNNVSWIGNNLISSRIRIKTLAVSYESPSSACNNLISSRIRIKTTVIGAVVSGIVIEQQPHFQ